MCFIVDSILLLDDNLRMASTHYSSSPKNVNRETLTARASEKTGISRPDCHAIVSAVFDAMIEEIAQGHRIEIRGLGGFRFVIKDAKFYPANFPDMDRDTVFMKPRRVVAIFRVSESLQLRVAKLKVPNKPE